MLGAQSMFHRHTYRWNNLLVYIIAFAATSSSSSAAHVIAIIFIVDTVKELLNHSDIKTTLRYAHLAPEHKADAVAKLVNVKFLQK